MASPTQDPKQGPTLTWFRTPTAERPGTTNLCYHALDRRVILGEATAPAVITPGRTYDVASLLEEVGALAGVLRALGVEPGDTVAIGLEEPFPRAVATLAALRVGAVVGFGGGDDRPEVAALTISDGSVATVEERPALLRGVPVADPVLQVDWDIALRAGRAQPAPVADVAGDAPALALDHATLVLTRDVLAHDSEPARLLGALAAGEVVEL